MYPAASDRNALARRGRHLEIFTIAWNSLEGLVAIAAGAVAGSISLVGFGVDSLIEVTSGAALFWRLRAEPDAKRREVVERRSLQIVGWCFLGLAAYVAYEAASSLWRAQAPERSVVGIALAAASLVVMPLLARAKRKIATGLGSVAMRADARQSDFCAYLSAVLLGGLLLNASLGWWWADPIAALVMVPVIAFEGRQALKGQPCADCT